MSQSNHSLIVSVQKLQDIENTLDSDNITCSLFANSRPLGVFKLTDFQNPISMPNVSPNDTLQFMFYKNDHQELYGCVSFIAKQFIDVKQENVQQWATLFEDPEDDVFDGRIGEDDEELPRALLNVVVKKGEFLIHQEDESQINFEAGLKEKVQEIYLQQTLEFSSVACPRFDEHFQKSCDLSLISSHNTKILESPEKSQAQIAAVNLEEIHMDLTQVKCPFNLERKSSVGSHNLTENSIEDLMVHNSKKEIGETHTTIGSTIILDNKHGNKVAESSLHHAKEYDCKLQTNGTLSNIKEDFHSGSIFLKQENVKLQERVQELEVLLEKLVREDAIRSENEELKLSTLKAELEVLKADKENCEKKLNETEALLKTEKALKEKFEILLKEKENETMKTDNNTSTQELNALRIQVKLDETVIQNLHKEIFSLRQKEDESLELNIKLLGASQTINDYEEKIDSLVEALGVFNIQRTESQSLEEFVAKVQEMLPQKAKEMEELKNTNEDLTIRLSICDNKLLADSLLAQIDGLKSNVASLEKERESMKDELHKANEKYMNLSNKYVELSDFFTGSKKTSQSEQATPAARSSTPNLKRSTTKPKVVQKNESVDDIEAKLIEFTAFHKIQPFLLTRIDYGVYLYAGKKVYLKLQDGQLVVKVGDIYKPFQDFLKPKNSTTTNTTTTTVTPSSVSANKPNPKNLKLLLKDVNKEERSFDQKTKVKTSNYSSVQIDQSQRDLSSDLGTTSRSICKENARSLVRQLYQTSSTVMDIKNSSIKTLTRMDSNLKLKEILTSRMVDRRLSYGIYQKRDKIQRDLTPL